MFKEHCPTCGEEQNVNRRQPEFDDQDPANEPVVCLECGNPVYAH